MSSTPPSRPVKAPRNRTIELFEEDLARLRPKLTRVKDIGEKGDAVVCRDAFDVLPRLAGRQFDLLFADPPYNLTRRFGSETFRERTAPEYEEWLDSWLRVCVPMLSNKATVYICGDWRSGGAIERVGSRYFQLRNRITWEREKGRGASANWKNACEDIWFFTVSDDYTFNIDAVKSRRRVIAPYTENGKPKDWVKSDAGNYRDTHPSNIWTDISVPFWSMPENTEHPTQKPEKLLAKLLLASTNEGDRILDPFAGSGTTAVVAKKLGRSCVSIEAEEKYCLYTLRRLEMATSDTSIQGFEDGVFWERNSRK